jgi:SAM-dependent methyltransferase
VTDQPDMGHDVAIAAIEDGDLERGHALLADAVSSAVDLELLNDLGVASHMLGRLDEAEAILTTASVLDAGREDVAQNLAVLAELRDGAAWRTRPGVGGSDPRMWERAFPGMPNHGTMAEHAARYAFALQWTGGRDVLDLGCGTGYGSEMLTWSAERVRGFDIWRPEPGQGPRWPGGAELHYGHDLCRDELPEADVATAFEVIEHLPDAPAALRRAFSAVDVLVASFPNPEHHGSHMNQWHVNDWSLEQFEDELRAAAKGRFAGLDVQHFFQPLGSTLLREGREPEGSFWVVVARGDVRIGR